MGLSVDEMIEKCVSEYSQFATGQVFSSAMILGAWGTALVQRFANLDSTYFRRFIERTYDVNRRKVYLVTDALRAASLTAEEAEVREQLFYDSERAMLAWLERNYGKKPGS